LDPLEWTSSVNDGAPWIERIARMNFPRATQIVDWSHGMRRLWAVASAIYGDGKPGASAWMERRKDELWDGKVEPVIQELDALKLRQSAYPDDVQ
jgi:hypothetical protein